MSGKPFWKSLDELVEDSQRMREESQRMVEDFAEESRRVREEMEEMDEESRRMREEMDEIDSRLNRIECYLGINGNEVTHAWCPLDADRARQNFRHLFRNVYSYEGREGHQNTTPGLGPYGDHILTQLELCFGNDFLYGQMDLTNAEPDRERIQELMRDLFLPVESFGSHRR